MVEDRRSSGRRWGRTAAALALLLLMLGGAGWWLSLPVVPGAFYAPPPELPGAPGRLLRAEPFTAGIPAGARAWRILYTTARPDGSSAVGSAIVMVPDGAGDGPHPVIAWAHGTTGIARGCAPSLLDDPFEGMPAVEELLREGRAVVAADYVGLGTPGDHAYLVGEEAARAVLDSVRAALGAPDWRLDNRIVVWGHSQGGHGALWAGMRAGSYAPELNVTGIAAMAPASDLVRLLEAGRSTGFGKLVSSFVFEAYRNTYRDIDGSYASPWGRLLARDISRRCLAGRGVLWSILAVALMPRDGLFVRSVSAGPLGAHLEANTPSGPIGAPLLLAQGQADDAVLPEVQRRYVAGRCAAGQAIDYREYPGLDHMGLVGAQSPMVGDLLAWTGERLDGRPASGRCPQASGRAAPAPDRSSPPRSGIDQVLLDRR